jgi:hypothetical protein
MNGTLCLHAGARIVDPEVLREVHTPEPTASWTPVPHCTLVKSVRGALTDSGAEIVKEEHALYRDGARYFGLLHLGENNDGGNTVVGIRNSHDKTFPAGLSLGNRVFVCDNLSFSGDVTVARKHTRFIGRDLDRLIYAAVGKLADLKVKQAARFTAYRNFGLTNPEAHDLIIRALLARVISGEGIAKVVAGWREPEHEEFRVRNVWSLFNSFTEVLKGINPTAALKRTMTLHGLLDAHCELAV